MKALLSKRNIFGKWNWWIIIFFEVIHPNFGSTTCIASKNVPTATREAVRMTLSEDVTNSWARNNFQWTATHPNSKTEKKNWFSRKNFLFFWNSKNTWFPDFHHPKRPFSCHICPTFQNKPFWWQKVHRQSLASKWRTMDLFVVEIVHRDLDIPIWKPKWKKIFKKSKKEYYTRFLPNSNQSHRVGQTRRQCTGMCPCWWHQWRDKRRACRFQPLVPAMAPATVHCTHSDCPRRWVHRQLQCRRHAPSTSPGPHVCHCVLLLLYLFWLIQDHLRLKKGKNAIFETLWFMSLLKI